MTKAETMQVSLAMSGEYIAKLQTQVYAVIIRGSVEKATAKMLCENSLCKCGDVVSMGIGSFRKF